MPLFDRLAKAENIEIVEGNPPGKNRRQGFGMDLHPVGADGGIDAAGIPETGGGSNQFVEGFLDENFDKNPPSVRGESVGGDGSRFDLFVIEG